MKHLPRVLVVCAALFPLSLLGLLGGPPPAMACVATVLPGSVIDPDAEVVFTGTAVRLDDPRGFLDTTWGSADAMAWTFVVDDVQRGFVPERVTVYSERMEASCGYEFELGQRYRVVADGPPDSLHVGMAGGTKPIESLAQSPPVEHSISRIAVGWVVMLSAALLIIAVPAYLVLTRSSARGPA